MFLGGPNYAWSLSERQNSENDGAQKIQLCFYFNLKARRLTLASSYCNYFADISRKNKNTNLTSDIYLIKY